LKKLLKKELPLSLKVMQMKPLKLLKKLKKDPKMPLKKLKMRLLKKKLNKKEQKNSLPLSPKKLILKLPLVKLTLYSTLLTVLFTNKIS
jgi:hypothetical protein